VTGFVNAFLQTELKEKIQCQFNPSELTITKANTWNPPPKAGGDAPNLTFQAGQSGTLALSLTLDTTHNGQSVTGATDKLLNLMTPATWPTRRDRRGCSSTGEA
jgi:hypothetical protein